MSVSRDIIRQNSIGGAPEAREEDKRAHFSKFAAEECTPRHNMTMKADRNTKNQNLVLESTDTTARSGGSLFRTVLTDTPLRLNMVSYFTDRWK
jgi:hypothetical protein